jgi:glutamate racemase
VTSRLVRSAALLVALGVSPDASGERPAAFADVARKKPDVTIVVTDSGLGGHSVAADLKREADKVRVFDGALAAMEARYEPDLILIACNTLSVVYPGTAHAKKGGTETVEIVGLGADLIRRGLAAKPDATALVFATKTTIESGAHKKLLVEKGVPAGHVVGEACPRLAGAIERGSASEETVAFVKRFIAEALEKKPAKGGPLVVSLNCTHFGYVRPLWERAFAAAGYPGVSVLDPNPLMTDLVLREGGEKRFPKTAVTVEAVSKVPIDEATRANLGALLRTTSPETAEALAHIRHEPALFPAVVDPAAVIAR